MFPLLNVLVEALLAFCIDDNTIFSNCHEIIKNILKEQYYSRFWGFNFLIYPDEDRQLKKIINNLLEFNNVKDIEELKKIINNFLREYKKIFYDMHKIELYDYQIETLPPRNDVPKNIIPIDSLSDYIKKTIGYKKNGFWFRGHSSVTHRLIAGIFRSQDYIGYEVNKLQYFMMRAPAFYKECPADNDYNRWLPFMQHYELPTRLLDWTDSPLCALFFALYQQCPPKCDKDNFDAVVYAFSPNKWNKEFHEISGKPILDYNKNEAIDFVERAFKVFYQPIKIKPLAISAVRRYSRMLNQQANFTIHDSAIDMYELQPSSFIKFTISKDNKENILKELFDMGIDKTTYFPELTALAEVTKKFA